MGPAFRAELTLHRAFEIAAGELQSFFSPVVQLTFDLDAPGLGCALHRKNRNQRPGRDMMDEAGFWKIIQDAHDTSGGDMDRKCDLLRQRISSLSAAEAIEFAELFDAAMNKTYSFPLWGAAYVINGGCSDDTFTDFRASLISRGRQAFERALSDPDSLADEPSDDEDWFYEGYQYAVTDGVEAAGAQRPQGQMPAEPAGVAWQEDDLDALFPKLSEKFG
jgi:hypothetical protein